MLSHTAQGKPRQCSQAGTGATESPGFRDPQQPRMDRNSEPLFHFVNITQPPGSSFDDREMWSPSKDVMRAPHPPPPGLAVWGLGISS